MTELKMEQVKNLIDEFERKNTKIDGITEIVPNGATIALIAMLDEISDNLKEIADKLK